MSQATAPQSSRPNPYAPWAVPDYRLYSACWFLMVVAKQIETVAVGVYLYYTTNNPLTLGLMGLVQALPVMLLAIAGGHLADRYNRRSVLLITLAVSGVSGCGLLAYSVHGGPLWIIYLCLATGATAAALGGPSRAALVPQLVKLESVSSAVTWSATVFQIAMMVGPSIAGQIVRIDHEGLSGGEVAASGGPVAAFMVVVLARAMAVLLLAGVRAERSAPAGEPISLESVLSGVRFVWATKPILATITLDLFAVLLGGFTYLLPVFVKDILQADVAWIGYLQSAEAVGAIGMAVALAHLPPLRRPGVAMLLAVAGFGVAVIAFGLSRNVWLSLGMMFAIGALDNISVVVRHTLVQVLTPDAMRGRVSAVHNVFIVASNDLGGFESGLVAWLVGPIVTVVAGGIGTILVVCGAAVVWPQLRSLGPLNQLKPADPSREDETQV